MGDRINRNALNESELAAEEDTQSHIALPVPNPPVGLAEFALARYLYVQTCDVSIEVSVSYFVIIRYKSIDEVSEISGLWTCGFQA